MLRERKYLFGTTILASVLALSAPAFAQTAPTQDPDEDEEEAAAVVEEIVVVGSRIARDVYNSPSPVQVINREESTLAGLATTTEILQGVAVTGGTSQINNLYSGFVVNGGPGVNTIGLRGLGPTRTLVLLNGRRVAPAGSRGSVGSADLNVLPSALIERVEVLRDGASSIYGSDAVAGVINIVTRADIEGVVIEGNRQQTTQANGAGNATRLSIAGGIQGERWSFLGSVERFEREEVKLGDVEHAQCPTAGPFLPNTAGFEDFIDPLTGQPKCFSIDNGGVTVNTIATSARTGIGAYGSATPGTLGTYNRWRPNSAVTSGLIGFEGVSGASLDIRDTYDPRMLEETLFSPVATTTAFMSVGYDLRALGNAEVYAETLLNKRESSSLGGRQLVLDYAVGSLLIPANLSAGGPLAGDLGLTPGRNTQVRVFPYHQYNSEQDVTFAKQVLGIRGDLPISNWTYDVYASYTNSRSEYQADLALTSRLINSLDVVAAPAGTPAELTRSGIGPAGTQVTVTCRVNVGNTNANCVPAPFITNDTIGGYYPQDFINYVEEATLGVTSYDEFVVSGGFGGELFSLPAGEVQFYLGAEFREASIDDTPDIASQTGDTYNFSTSAITRGEDSVWEVFGEVEVPLLRDLPIAKELTLSASGRYTDYESYGDDTTYKVGLLYQITDWVGLRATYGTSYRAPALFEQFLGATAGFLASTTDVCNDYDAAGRNPNLAANCASEGLPPGFTATSSVRQLNAGGAAAGLAAETSTNFTGGVVFTPTLPGRLGTLAVAVDYYDIQIDNGVSQVGSAFILNQCYTSSAADFAAGAGYCAFVERAPVTNSLTVTNGYVNIATNVVEGIDYNLRYRNSFGPGDFLVNLNVTQYLERYNQLFPTDPIYTLVGRLGTPEYSASMNVQYSWDQWSVFWGTEWIDATTEEDDYFRRNGQSLKSFGIDSDLEEYFLHSASVRWGNDDLSVVMGVRNVFDVDPPSGTGYWVGGIGNSPTYSGYDQFGRTLFFNVAKSF